MLWKKHFDSVKEAVPIVTPQHVQRMKDGLVRDEQMYNEKLEKFRGSR